MEPYAELKESHGINPASGVFDDLVPIALAFVLADFAKRGRFGVLSHLV